MEHGRIRTGLGVLVLAATLASVVLSGGGRATTDADANGSPVASPLASPAPVVRHTVRIMRMRYEPERITIPAGSTVEWVNREGVPHTVTFPGTDSGRMDRGSRFAVTFDEPGRYPYVCFCHQNMTGVVIVE